MGENTNINMRLGHIINKRTPAKIISVLMVFLMVSTAFSATVFAERPIDKIKEKVTEIIDKIVDKAEEIVQEIKDRSSNNSLINSAFKEMSLLKREKNPIFSLVTKYNDTETSTRLRLFLPTAIDVNGDGKKDVRVWVFRRPGIDLCPPAVCLRTTLLVRRLNDDIKEGPFEIYLDYTPKTKIMSKLLGDNSIRIGYQTPVNKEVPKNCIVTSKIIPHLIYPRLGTTVRIGINPVSIVGKSDSQLNLVFSVVNETADSKLTIQVNHSPAVKNELSFSLSKEHFVRLRGRTIEISRMNVVSSNVTVTIGETTKDDSGFVKIQNIPKKISLSWQLSTKGHLELNTHGAGTGPVDAAVDGVIALGFKPTKGVKFRLGWDVNRLTWIGLARGKNLNLEIDAKGSATLSDLYVYWPSFTLLGFLDPQKLKLTASLLSFDLKAGVDVGKLVIKPLFDLDISSANNIDMDVENLDVVLKNCTVGLQPIELPSVSITYPPEKDTIVSGTVPVSGTASAPPGREIKSVKITIDDGDEVKAVGTTSWSYDWDTTNLLNGKHSIAVECYDSQGYASSSSMTVVVNNPNTNWYPTVEILTPSELDVLTKDVVKISGTADDHDDTVTKVEIKIDKGINEGDWIKVDGTTQWSYEWDISKLSGGTHTIIARSYDSTNYTIDKQIRSNSKKVFVRFSDVFKASLSRASIDITNLAFDYIMDSDNKTSLTVTSFNAGGNGNFTLSDKAVSLDGNGDLTIVNTSVYMTNEADVKTTLLDNLSFNFNGGGYLEVSKGKLALELDASVSLSAENVIGIKNILFGVNGTASADILIEEQGGVKVGCEEDYFDFNITDLVLEVADIIKIGAKRISAEGTGSIYIKDKKITLSSGSIECHIDELSVNTTIGIFSVSGDLDFSKYGTIEAEFIDLFNFSVSYDGLRELVIEDFELMFISSEGTAIVSAESVNVKPDGHAEISYYKDDMNIICCIDVCNISIYDLALSFNELSYGPFDVDGDFEACFTLTSDIEITSGPDWICITIGGKGRATYLDIYAKLRNINNYRGYLDVNMSLASGDDRLVINISNLTGNVRLDVFASKVLSLDLFELYLENCTTDEELINISIENLEVGFDMHMSGEKGGIQLIVNQAGVSLDDGHVYFSLKDEINFALEGTIDVAMSSNVSGTLNIEFNDTGLSGLKVDFAGNVNVDITGLKFRYNNTKKSTDILLSAYTISIDGNANIVVTPEYINFGVGVINNNGPPTRDSGADNNKIVLDNFLFNASIGSLGFYLYVNFDLLQIENSISINISQGGIVIDSSRDITVEHLYMYMNYEPFKTYITLDLGSLKINGGGKIFVNESFGLISGLSGLTEFVIKDASLDIIIPDILLVLMLEDADISFVGADATFTIDLSEDNATIIVDLSVDSYINVKTLWIFPSNYLAMELRVKNLLISGPTVINVDMDPARNEIVIIKINAIKGIKADEFTVVQYINLYGVDGGPNISIGMAQFGDFLIGLEGLWHFDMMLLMDMILLTDVDLEGKLDPLLAGFNNVFIKLEGTAAETSVISFRSGKAGNIKAVIEIEPGTFVINLEEYLNLMTLFSGGEPDPKDMSIFGYSDSPITIKLLTFLGVIPIILDAVGEIEIDIDLNSVSIPAFYDDDELDIDLTLDLKGNWDRAKLFDFADINGSGDLNVDFQASGSIGNDLYLHLGLNWAGTRYVTFPEFLRFAVTGAGQHDWEIGDKPDSGEVIVETDQIEVVINENTQYITISDLEGNVLVQGTMQIYENGEIVIENTQGDTIVGTVQTEEGNVLVQGAIHIYENGEVVIENTQGDTILGPVQSEDLIINGINIAEQLNIIFNGKVHLWLWRPLKQKWEKILGRGKPDPVVEGAVTLLSRPAAGNELHANSWEILPGEALNFTAWYNPGPNNQGPYDFVFNYGDNSSSGIVTVDGSQQPIKVYPNSSSHMYTKNGTYTVRVTVIDQSNGHTATDTFTVYVVEKYLRLSGDYFIWNFEKINELLGEDGKLHDSFQVKNVAKPKYSNYVLKWNITGYEDGIIKYGKNWTFDSYTGVLGPNENQTVNFSFEPPSIPGDYDLVPWPDSKWNIFVNNVNIPDNRKKIDFDISYGLVKIYPNQNEIGMGKPILFVTRGEVQTFENVFWVYSNRWEILDWEICNKTYKNPTINDSNILITPSSGTINPGEPLTPISITVDTTNFDQAFKEGDIKITIRRNNSGVPDNADNDSINITIWIVDFPTGDATNWVTPDRHEQNWWFFPRRAHDNKLQSASYYCRVRTGWTDNPLILKLDNPIDCCGFRINAKAGDNLDKLEVKLYNGSSLQFSKTFLAGEWNHYDWTFWNSTTGTKSVNRAEIRMHLSSGTFAGHWAVVSEFDFKKA